MTDKTEDVYKVFADRHNAGKLPPTVREIVKEAGIPSFDTVVASIDLLVQDGRLIKDAKKSRGVRLPGIAGPDVGALQSKITAQALVIGVLRGQVKRLEAQLEAVQLKAAA